MPIPFIPWEPHNIPIEIQQELNRRKLSRGLQYVNNDKAGGWDTSTGDWSKYKGPMVSWVRVCSNGEGSKLKNKPRFVLFGGKGFDKTYGFQPNGSESKYKQTIGYMPDGQAHELEQDLRNSNYPIHTGVPEISKVDITVQKELLRRATIEWVCFSPKQLEYLTPYFLVPGISVMVEFGWNHFNPISLVNIGDLSEMKRHFLDTTELYKNSVLSKGNYEVIYGIVTNFGWTIEGSKIICTTEITSKDKLYAGLTKNSALIINSTSPNDKEGPGILQGIKTFVNLNEKQSSLFTNFKLLKDINVNDRKSITNFFANYSGPSKQPFQSILSDLITLEKGDLSAFSSLSGETEQQKRERLKDKVNFIKDAKLSYIKGIFTGREKGEFSKFLTPQAQEMGDPQKYDFDASENKDLSKLWINMGLITDILNYFSYLPGTGDIPQFKVDIDTSVIGAHPNMISCDPNVLIPNYQSPKYYIGTQGLIKYSGNDSNKDTNANNEYYKQYQLSKNKAITNLSAADDKVRSVYYQTPEKKCFRVNLDSVINVNRYVFGGTSANDEDRNRSYSFPSQNQRELYNKKIVEKDYSGLLTNIYISFKSFKDIIDADDVKTYQDIYLKIIDMLMKSTDNFWDLALVEAEGVLTIVDRNYINLNNKGLENKVYSFDYYDADSFIKSIKFRPQLSDAQATRAIYGSSNNSGSKSSLTDREDLLNYQFKDLVNAQDLKPNTGTKTNAEQEKFAKEQMRDIVRGLHTINDSSMDTLQMTLANGEIIKLVMPSGQQKLLRATFDDGNEEKNQRYCGIQPGITMDMTIQGIGGIRTFQYFLIKNLPEPYSEKNIIFRIVNVSHDILSGEWNTNIQAGLIPLTKYIKMRLF